METHEILQAVPAIEVAALMHQPPDCAVLLIGHVNLDNGEECVCPQGITHSLICKWFRAAVLPLDAGLCAALFPAPSVGQRRCRECGRTFTPPKHNTLYCSTCAAERVKRSKRAWAKKNRADV